MTAKQNNEESVSLEKRLARDSTTSETRSVNAGCQNGESTTCTGGDRQGWREYFLRARKENSKRREIEMKTNDELERLMVRSVSTLWTIVILIGLVMFASAAASAKTITVTGTGDEIDANDNQVTLREAICAANKNSSCGDAPGGTPGLDTGYCHLRDEWKRHGHHGQRLSTGNRYVILRARRNQ